MRRREFLGVLAGSAAGITLGQVGFRHLLPGRKDPARFGRKNWGLTHEREALSICGGCEAGCSVWLRIVDERLVGIRGNPYCPLGKGGLCARGANEIEAFYDPDRLLGPILRDGSRGSDKWKRTSWDNAIKRITERLIPLISKDGSDRVAAICSSAQGVTSAVLQRVLAGWGSPHLYSISSLRDEAVLPFSSLAFGSVRPHGYDFGNTDLILSFGTPVLDGWLSPAFVAQRFGQGRGRTHRRLKLIQIESRLSATAIRADRWVRCEPGKEQLLALGIAQVMLNQGLVDQSALQRITGLYSWRDQAGDPHVGFKTILDKSYQPDAVSRQTGVSEKEIRELAHRFARADAPVALAELTSGSSGVFGLAAVHLLNALANRFSKPGGIVFPKPPPLDPLQGAELSQDKRLDGPPMVPFKGTNVWRVLSELHRKGVEPPFDVLFVEDGAALNDITQGDPAYEMLEKIPLTISLATSLDRSAKIADLVLPSTTPYEQAIDIEVPASGSFSAVAAAQKALSPLVDGRPRAEVFMELGRRIGSGTPLPRSNLREVVSRRLQGLVASGRGQPYGSTPGSDRPLLQKHQKGDAGAEAFSSKRARISVDDILSAGGWIERLPPDHSSDLEQPYELDARTLRRDMRPSRLFPLSLNDETWFPRIELVSESTSSKHQLLLVPVTLGALTGNGTPNRPSMFQISSAYVQGAFQPWAELHPITAKKLGIDSSRFVHVESDYGQTTVPLRLSVGVRPGTVALIWAPSAKGYGRYARSFQGGAELLAAGMVGITGPRAVAGLPVRVQAAEGVRL